MNLLFENWKQFLTEVTFEQAKNNLNDKTINKAFKAAIWDLENGELETSAAITQKEKTSPDYELPRSRLHERIPDDIQDNQKGSALLWLIRTILKKPPTVEEKLMRALLTIKLPNRAVHQLAIANMGVSRFESMGSALETFFQHNRFMSKPDINSIKTLKELIDVVEAAKPDIQAYLDKQSYLDAEQGKQVIYEDDSWQIIIPTNKGAACEIGKGTDWCTAAPGLDYYEEYHKPNDPLFVFINKQKPEERYQFHFGSKQFMDRDDDSIEDDVIFYKLIHLLKRAENVPARIKREIKNVVYQKLDNGGTHLVDLDGNKVWHLNGKLHRTDGPAIERVDGGKQWWLNGDLHRTDGPAIDKQHS